MIGYDEVDELYNVGVNLQVLAYHILSRYQIVPIPVVDESVRRLTLFNTQY